MIGGAQQIPSDLLTRVLLPIYVENGGDRESFSKDAAAFVRQIDPKFRNILTSLKQDMLQRNLWEQTFRRWLANNKDSAFYRKVSQLSEAKQIAEDIGRSLFTHLFYQNWTRFKDAYFADIDELDLLLPPNDAVPPEGMIRQIMHTARRTEASAQAVEAALADAKSGLTPANMQRFRVAQGGAGEIMLGECQIIVEIREAIKNLIANDPSDLSQMRVERPDLLGAIRMVRSTLIRLDDPLNFAQRLYVGYTNQRRIGVNVSILGDYGGKHCRRPMHPYWTRELIKSIVVIATRLGTNRNPVSIELMWTDRPTHGIFVSTAALDKMLGDPMWEAEVAQLQIKLGIVSHVKFYKRPDGTPVVFFPVELVQPAQGGIPRGRSRSRREGPRRAQDIRPRSRLTRPFRAMAARARRFINRPA